MWVWAKHYQPFTNKSPYYFRRAKGDKLKLPSMFFRGGYDTYVNMWDTHWKNDKQNYEKYGKYAKSRWQRNKHVLPYKEWLKHARKYAAKDRRAYIAKKKLETNLANYKRRHPDGDLDDFILDVGKRVKYI